MPEIKKLTTECSSCDKFFVIAFSGDEEPEICPFCGSTISDDEEIPDDIEEENELDFSTDIYEVDDSYEN